MNGNKLYKQFKAYRAYTYITPKLNMENIYYSSGILQSVPENMKLHRPCRLTRPIVKVFKKKSISITLIFHIFVWIEGLFILYEMTIISLHVLFKVLYFWDSLYLHDIHILLVSINITWNDYSCTSYRRNISRFVTLVFISLRFRFT